jgi:division protein CdvB (Snf7/Vps24/ESCRT-III family)
MMVKLMFMAGALLGTGTVAMENEAVNEVVTEKTLQVKQMIQKKLGVVTPDQVKEFGYPYPNETFLASLTEDQAFEVISFIDQANATYDWQNMTDEEIEVAISDIKASLHDLYDELGVEPLAIKERVQQGFRKGKSADHTSSPNGTQDGTQDGECDLDTDSI